MNFKKVELYGFKSFADKAEISFGDGITCIVGPNGCGKSNVADAIRWVLGEQSAKTLRGSSMQDVIFSGTQNRKSLSYCEVSLYFDNSEKMFSLDYNEVVITRKLYRDGKSEYYINKQDARLKDIVNLLHECGIGKEGYTIIGQGKVEEIMSAKPEDRRLIFEEATGIAKFKTDKNETERKLLRTRENLVRYVDIMTEIENQLGPLERQAEKAKEFNELSESLKFNEINCYVCKVEGVADAKSRIGNKIKGIDEETALRKSELSKAQTEYDKIFEDINGADEKLKNLNEEMLQKRLGLQKSDGAKQLYQEKISYLLSQIERAKNEIIENQNTIKECESSILESDELITSSNEELTKASKKADELTKRLLSVAERISLGEELASKSHKKIIESIESLSNFKQSKGEMSATQSSLTEKLSELQIRLDELSYKREEQFNAKDKCDKTINDLDKSAYDTKNNILAKEDEIRKVNEDVAKLDSEIYSLNSHITTLVTRDNFYREMKENYEGYAPAVKLLFKDAKTNPELSKRIHGVVAKLITSDKKYDVALETALAAAAQNVVTPDTEDTKYLIKYLKANNYSRLTFLPLTSVKPRVQTEEITRALKETGALGVANELVSYDKKYERVISNLLTNTLIVDTLDNATAIANKYGFAFKIVTLDGDEFSTRGAMSGGSRRKDAAGILSNERKIEDNLAVLKEKRAQMEKLQEQKKALEKKRDLTLDEYNILNDLYREKHQSLILEREKQSVCEKSLSEIGREIENVTDMIEEVQGKLNKVLSDYESMASGGKKFEQDRNEASKNADVWQQEYDALKVERENLIKENSDLQVKITELKGIISTATSDKERLLGVLADCTNNIKQLENSNVGAEEIIENLRREQEKIAFTKEEQDYVNKIREDIDNIEIYKNELREKLNFNAQRKEALSEEITALSEKKHAEEIALAKIDSDLEYMGQSIFEDYGETYETAVKLRADDYDLKTGEAEISRIRRKRSSLGAINATAIDEFKALKERYEEMSMQKEDLEKAETDLKVAIDKIKAEMLAQFDEGFKQINENFQRIFKELFGGGRAMLQMDYSEVDDKLEAGVEIVAEPPGKKLQKLSLLSGGEKALTAIAILFSILKLRPMPFCVLDEIEAALDEANVDRFARYLQKFSEETQFIVITHRKPTMELADALFGVTMQEKGVSRLVSVKLSDIAEIEGDGTL